MHSATPRQSKPGPRFEVLAGTRTVTCCIRRRSVAAPSFSGNRSVPRKSELREPPRLICGNPAENLQTITTERRLKFGIDFGAGFSVGLFPDQRENRSFVRHIAPKRLLNCFAYTCSFSVGAAYV